VPCLAQFPNEFGLDYWPVTVSNLYSHVTKRFAADLVPSQVRKRARRFLLGSLDMREFFPLFINGDLVALANVEKIPLHELRTLPKALCSYSISPGILTGPAIKR
jgi:hypothetical protein